MYKLDEKLLSWVGGLDEPTASGGSLYPEVLCLGWGFGRARGLRRKSVSGSPLLGLGWNEPGASGGHLSPEVLGLVFSGSVPVVGVVSDDSDSRAG